MAAPALAQTSPCAPNAVIVAGLAKGFQEKPAVQGVAKDGMWMQLFVNAVTGTWSIVVTRPDGISCVMSAGDGLEFGPRLKPGHPS